MKTRKQNPRDHIVPLSAQAVAIFHDLQKLTGGGTLRIPRRPYRIEAHVREHRQRGAAPGGYGKDEIVGHGFRAMARTILDEELGFRPEVVEAQLAHSVRDPQGRAYNRTGYLAERRRMMQRWAGITWKNCGPARR